MVGTPALDELYDLLERERAALLKGDLECIARHEKAKVSLSSQVIKHDLNPKQLLLLRKTMARNQELIASAAAGVRSAQERVSMLHRGKSCLRTYTAKGSFKESEPPPASLARRR